jgi:hypothetical protein
MLCEGERRDLKDESTVRSKKTMVVVGLILVGLLMIALSFEAEFHSYSTVLQTNIEQGTNAITTVLATKYYQIEVVGGEWAIGRLRGELHITRLGTAPQHFELNHLFWLAKRDIVDVGWFKPKEAGKYTITIFLEQAPRPPQETIMKLNESPLSAFMPNPALLGFGGVLVIAPLISFLTSFFIPLRSFLRDVWDRSKIQ